jgi:hypothetical protein
MLRRPSRHTHTVTANPGIRCQAAGTPVPLAMVAPAGIASGIDVIARAEPGLAPATLATELLRTAEAVFP